MGEDGSTGSPSDLGCFVVIVLVVAIYACSISDRFDAFPTTTPVATATPRATQVPFVLPDPTLLPATLNAVRGQQLVIDGSPTFGDIGPDDLCQAAIWLLNDNTRIEEANSFILDGDNRNGMCLFIWNISRRTRPGRWFVDIIVTHSNGTEDDGFQTIDVH